MIEKIEDFICESTKLLAQKTDEYNKYAQVIQDSLEKAIKNLEFKNIIIQTRVKNEDSLREKIYRKNYFHKYEDDSNKLISELPDIIGARIVCLLNDDEKSVFESLKDFCEDEYCEDKLYHVLKDENYHLYFDFSNQPQKQKNGHDIFRIDCKLFVKDQNHFINVELQIKSMVNFFWGELDHMLFYKNYAYLLSSEFYNQIMSEINNGLTNINNQLSNLRSQIERTEKKEIIEIKQIASLILYNQYNNDISSQLKCTVDLREIFDLITDIFFKNTANKEKNYACLNKMISQNTQSLDISKIDIALNGRLNPNEFTEKENIIAKTIDEKIKENDIFWLVFFMIFSSHFSPDKNNYNLLVKDICYHFLIMIRGFEDDLERIEDDCEDVYDAFTNAIFVGIAEAFFEIRKLNFFNYSINLNKTNLISSNIIRTYQHKIKAQDKLIIIRNLTSLTAYTKCKIIISVQGEINKELVKNLVDQLMIENHFDIPLNSTHDIDFAKDKLSLYDYVNIFGEENINE
ncbi:MAG: hypothetical protein BGN88_12605 [Clostridiales bacterium 43-6]|nr:MAG: hypothetical protein BGN88_12605 [Clostridiales bacterium 43-6]